MTGEQLRYDIAIIGSGISGSSLGAILARHGLRVIIFEAGVHPRFAVGESMILETSETMRVMAELFDVPELAYFSSAHYLAQIGSSHGLKRRIDTIIEAVDPCDEAAVDRAVAEIRALYAATPLVPWAFRQVLAGTNHLPRNKLRLSLLRQSSAGFLGEGAFRRHFFGDATMAEVARFFASESLKYSATNLALQKRLGFRRPRRAVARRRMLARG